MNIPNRLTLLRFPIATVLVLVFLLDFVDENYKNNIAALIFLIGCITDILDGFIARKYDCITSFGICIDPIADKVLIISAMVSLVFVHRLSPIVAIVLIERDIIMIGFRMTAAINEIIIPALVTGKIKMIFESILVFYLLINGKTWFIILILKVMSIFFAYFSLLKVILKHKELLEDIK